MVWHYEVDTYIYTFWGPRIFPAPCTKCVLFPELNKNWYRVDDYKYLHLFTLTLTSMIIVEMQSWITIWLRTLTLALGILCYSNIGTYLSAPSWAQATSMIQVMNGNLAYFVQHLEKENIQSWFVLIIVGKILISK